MAKRFVYKKGFRAKVPAQAAGERLDELREQNNDHVTPKIIVNDARPDEAVLHPHFEWDDPKAAELYREDQARHLLQNVFPIVVNAAGEEEAVRPGWIHVDDPHDGPIYVTSERATKEPAYKEQMEADCLAGLESWRNRYANITRFATLFREVDRILAAEAARKRRRDARKGKRNGDHPPRPRA